MAAELRTSNANTEAAPSGLTTVDIDPEGDLLIDANSCRFRVCSNALRRQSPVWQQMLFGPWKEAKPTDGSAWIVEFPDDPAYPLRIILFIIHGKFELVPPHPLVISIYNILILAQKYDMIGIARPWCSQWLKAASEFNLPAADVVRSLYIAWELGDEHLFALRLEEISVQARIDSEYRLVYGEDIILEDEIHLGPYDVLDYFRYTYGFA
ncbi:hypothetical protein NEUTE1DRAFT_40387 [Neurospora tetrasperma FGSC 2508]|uniref:BTB domain-containing protein n=1 Tax=Neurospora tetrasperma (strain FGSC 2508 / ATCC MYA-4615 / P0657) TaxID=510951 RepID=F8MFY6_NEUT8|nr:uncharacterized protein NEUTE1DRAFT_40387 [Neurospora tetrasperma FGSC 2508]EGO59362.1 hypothetical protein NEUTE1DRAFT_40387 [Neurospora tetrasperma FGSC 2508]EGZ73482.1 hypothetical protein NEUTE2DRAFT_127843 [Neurospora tetrasperma FGSC 2509]